MVTGVSSVVSTRRERWAWYLYDFGNSAYASVVLLAVYGPYFKEQVVGGAEGSRLWGLAVAVAMIVVAVASPVLGAIADFSGTKKRFLFFFTAMSCLFTAFLFFVQRGDVVAGMVLFIIAEIGYRAAQVYYNGLLPEIAAPHEMGRISGIGWGVGAIGGIVCLLLIMPVVSIVGGDLAQRLSLVITAAFFALFAVPVFLWLRERARPQPLPAGESYATAGFKRLWNTFRAARRYREFLKFMLAFLIYNDGIITVLNFGAIIGAVLFGLDQQGLLLFVLLILVMNGVGSFFFGFLVDRTGCKRALALSLLLMLAVVAWLYFTQSQAIFFLLGALAGFAMAGAQSVSRTMVAVLAPAGQSAEFSGLFAVVGRTSSFIGPAVYGWVAAEAALWFQAQGRDLALAEQSGQRLALLSIAAFLLVGLALLSLVDERKGRKAAIEAAGGNRP
jgi:MFS transporter, UMF1 family